MGYLLIHNPHLPGKRKPENRQTRQIMSRVCLMPICINSLANHFLWETRGFLCQRVNEVVETFCEGYNAGESRGNVTCPVPPVLVLL